MCDFSYVNIWTYPHSNRHSNNCSIHLGVSEERNMDNLDNQHSVDKTKGFFFAKKFFETFGFQIVKFNQFDWEKELALLIKLNRIE